MSGARVRLDTILGCFHLPDPNTPLATSVRGPPICWCRKPLPGRGVELIRRHRLEVAHCLHVGNSPTDRAFAERLAIPYQEASTFFAAPGGRLPV